MLTACKEEESDPLPANKSTPLSRYKYHNQHTTFTDSSLEGEAEFRTTLAGYITSMASGRLMSYIAARIATDSTRFPPAESPANMTLSAVVPEYNSLSNFIGILDMK